MNDKNETQAAQSPAPDTPEKLTPDTSTPDTSTPDESAPDFVFLGLPRAEWGPETEAAFYAEVSARKAAADSEAAANECKRLLEEVASAESALSALEEAASLTEGKKQAAESAFSSALTQDEIVAAQLEKNKAEAEAQELVEKTVKARQVLDCARASLYEAQKNAGWLERVAKMERQNADALADRASNIEIPGILAEKKRQKKEEYLQRVYREQLSRRESFMKTTCRDCRFWLPKRETVDSGECHARPPVSTGFPSVAAYGWCGLCAPLPDSSPAAGAGAPEQA